MAVWLPFRQPSKILKFHFTPTGTKCPTLSCTASTATNEDYIYKSRRIYWKGARNWLIIKSVLILQTMYVVCQLHQWKYIWTNISFHTELHMEGRKDEMYFLCSICYCFCFIILRGSYLLILSSAGLYVGRRDSDTGLYFNCSTSCIMCNYQDRIHSSEVQIHSFVSY